MGSSAESAGVGGGTGVVENGSGSIVWVRRRNGSWWPGKILGPEELSATHLMSPRSGTPVKLLGREDASVDWYNLEKSKRVKAFRCGEFDDCIERAEASLGLPAKKREKYARREDAILHALELEKQFLEKKYGKVRRPNAVREISSDHERNKLVASSGALENGNGKLGHHELCQLDRKVDICNTVERSSIPLRAPKAKDAIQPSQEEHSTEVSPKIKGLRDFGLKAVPINKMLYTSGASEDSNRTPIDGHACTVSGSYPCIENCSDSDSRNSIGKGKRLLEGYVEVSLPKRHHRNHMFDKMRHINAELPDHSLRPDVYAKVLSRDGVHCSMYMPVESSEIFTTNHPQGQMDLPVSRLEVGTHHPQHGTFAEESTSGSSEETESDSSETHSLEPHVEARMLLSDAETRIRAQPRLLDRLEMQVGQESISSDESEELSFDDRSQFHFRDPNTSDVGVSKWQLKGKRNVRNMSKRPTDRVTHGTDLEARGSSLNQRAASHSLGSYHDNGYTNDADYVEDDFDHQAHGLGNRGYLSSQAAARRQNYGGRNMIDWEEFAWGRPFRGYWQDRSGCFNPLFVGRIGHDMLIDVDLTVQANRQGAHAPWVSLMSRLNGKAIIGHPVQIETLEDGSTEDLVSASDVLYDSDRSRVPPVWRTARRTANFRVPRPHLSSQMDGDEDTDYQHLHQSGKVRSKKSLTPNSARKASLSKKTHPHISRSPQGLKKPPRKVNLSSNQKTKTLSSIGLDQKFANETRDNDTSYYMDGMIKPVDSAPPTVACIPVKLVFSRLLEAVGRSPSGPAKHGASVNSNKERNPS